MKNGIKFLSLVMTFCMIFSAMACLSVLPVFAAEESEDEVKETIDYYTTAFASKEEKLASMTLRLSKNGFELYSDDYSGEIAVRNVKTNDILFTNPYDVASSGAAKGTKDQLLSQLVIKYSGTSSGYMYSFTDAALKDQIKVKNIKNGIRVEYTFGQQETRLLIPQRIKKDRFEDLILNKITDATKQRKVNLFFSEKNLDAEGLTNKEKDSISIQYPITSKFPIYVFDEKANDREKREIEAIIKEFCPEYTYEEVEYDHELVEFEEKEQVLPVFRLALEYTIDELGLTARLPSNGIRFDQSLFQLEYIRILPYMGAGSSEFTGYTMIPDGSGTLIRFEDVVASGSARMISGKLYGPDFAYHTISDARRQIMRLPMFGLVENTVYTVPTESDGETTAPDSENTTEEPQNTDLVNDGENIETPVVPAVTYQKKTGYVAIIEEGDSLATVVSDHGGNQIHKYNSVYIEVDARPKDTYNLASSISVAGNSSWTVVSDRKYTGSYKIRYIMLSDLEYAKENGIDTNGLYDASYVGMANAYREMLIKEGSLTALKQNDANIPLYLETLGAMDVQDKFLSIPVTVTKPLTTFDDIKTITNELGDAGINNLVYKLSGYINGGMKNTAPTKINVESIVGGEDGFKDLLKFAAEKNDEIFLDIDFSYLEKEGMFDGFSKKDFCVKTIDGRYTQKREYSVSLQYFTSTGLVAISPSKFTEIFNSAKTYLEELGTKSVSLGTLGSDLNSDFDEEDAHNRDDSEKDVVATLKEIKEAGYSVMLDGGNDYTVPYADHMLNVQLDSSRFIYASEAVPMFGLIYHGYVNYAGTPTNMAGDMRYEKLKLLENGANPYFILVYRNSEKLKEDVDLSKYYSISYEIWKEDLISTYNELNAVLSKVKYSEIVGHEFVSGKRIDNADDAQLDYEYISDNGMIVKLTFANGYSYILNYNVFDVTVEGYENDVIEELGYIVTDASGKVVINSSEVDK